MYVYIDVVYLYKCITGQSFNLHKKFTLIERLSNIHTANEDTLKVPLKQFGIKKLETLLPKELNQKLNND